MAHNITAVAVFALPTVCVCAGLTVALDSPFCMVQERQCQRHSHVCPPSHSSSLAAALSLLCLFIFWTLLLAVLNETFWEAAGNCVVRSCVVGSCVVRSCVVRSCVVGSCVVRSCVVRSCVVGSCVVGSCAIFTAHQIFCGNAIKDGEMGGACSMCWGF